jgi:hypothetical protein
MKLRFWKSKQENDSISKNQGPQLPKPKDLPNRIGIHLVTNLNQDPDWVWTLKGALRKKLDEKHTFDIRVFDPKEVLKKGVTITDFNSLDQYPEMILFEGWFNKDAGFVKIEKAARAAA